MKKLFFSFALIAITMVVFVACGAPTLKSIALETESQIDKAYVTGDVPDLAGQRIVVKLTDGTVSYVDIADGMFTPAVFKTAGEQNVVVSYTLNGVTKKISFKATVILSAEDAELAEAKENALSDLQTAFGGYVEGDYSEIAWSILVDAYNTAVNTISSATDVDVVNNTSYFALGEMAATQTFVDRGELFVVNRIGYTTLAAAISAVDEDGIIELFGNLNLGYNDDEQTELKGLLNIDKNITIKSRGSYLYTISGIMNWTPGESGFNSAAALIEISANVTIQNITLAITIETGVTGVGLIYLNDGFELLLDNVVYDGDTLTEDNPLILRA